MRKTLLIILILSLFACSNDAITDETVNTPTVTDEPIKEIKMAQGEIACIASGYIDVYTGEKMYASMGFIFDENDDIEDFQRGDLVKIEYYDEEKEDKTGKKSTFRYIENIEKTDIDYMYKNEYRIEDLVPFEIKEITYSICNGYDYDKVIESFTVEGEEVKMLLDGLNEIPLYSDANLVSCTGGINFKIKFIGVDGDECNILDHCEIKVEYNDDVKIYGYHYIGDNPKELYTVLNEYFDVDMSDIENRLFNAE